MKHDNEVNGQTIQARQTWYSLKSFRGVHCAKITSSGKVSAYSGDHDNVI